MSIPVLYIFPAMKVVKINPIISRNIERINSQLSTPNGNLAIIIIGEVNGIIDIQNAKTPSGLSIIGWIRIKENINGIVIGSINC